MKKHFSLDIGTRSIVGLLSEKRKGVLHILDFEQQEYPSRIMYDGQIHNIAEVAHVISQVRKSLEKRNKLELKKVGIALAGRALKTKTHRLEKQINMSQPISAAEIKELELLAVSNLLSQLNQNEVNSFQCIGYSVIQHQLDSIPFQSLEGHRGSLMSVEIIATFLPTIVFDSVLSALKLANLQPSNITLEPIAAMTAIIPTDLRKINLALVDIGAGTSDIAITKKGHISGYGMIPFAGDKVSEKISDYYLVDFPIAESIKRQLNDHETILFTDIFQQSRQIETQDIIETIRPVVRELAQKIAQEIIRLNTSPPRGVVLIGGGSLTAEIASHLNEALHIKREDIGFRAPNAIRNIVDETQKLNSLEFVTPIGISLVTAFDIGLSFMEIYLNGQPHPIIRFQDQVSARTALSSLGLDIHFERTKPGTPLTFELNGKTQKIPARKGSPGQLLINDSEAGIDNLIHPNDRITFIPPEEGQSSSCRINDLLKKLPKLNIALNDVPYEMPHTVYRNGIKTDPNQWIHNLDKIQIKSHTTARKMLEHLNYTTDDLFREIIIKLNGTPQKLRLSTFKLIRNQEFISLETPLFDGDAITFYRLETHHYDTKDILQLKAEDFIKITLNNKPILVPNFDYKIKINGETATEKTPIENGYEIITEKSEPKAKSISHLIKYLKMNPQTAKSHNLIMRVNGTEVGFTTHIQDGMKVDILWESVKTPS